MHVLESQPLPGGVGQLAAVGSGAAVGEGLVCVRRGRTGIRAIVGFGVPASSHLSSACIDQNKRWLGTRWGVSHCAFGRRARPGLRAAAAPRGASRGSRGLFCCAARQKTWEGGGGGGTKSPTLYGGSGSSTTGGSGGGGGGSSTTGGGGGGGGGLGAMVFLVTSLNRTKRKATMAASAGADLAEGGQSRFRPPISAKNHVTSGAGGAAPAAAPASDASAMHSDFGSPCTSRRTTRAAI